MRPKYAVLVVAATAACTSNIRDFSESVRDGGPSRPADVAMDAGSKSGATLDASSITSDGTRLGNDQSPDGGAGSTLTPTTVVGDAAPATTGQPDSCADACGCTSDACASSESAPDTPLDACSADQVALCISADLNCAVVDGSAVCVECRTDGDCTSPRSVCVDKQCETCDLVTHDGCTPQQPFCTDHSSTEASGVREASAPADRSCVECRTGDDCNPDTPLCVENSCVACVVDTDCTNPDAPRCDTTTKTCAGCNAIGQCSRFTDTSACNLNDGKCVECTAAERAACEDFACQTTPGDGQYTCSTQEVESAGRCEPCLSDAACDTGLACILENFEDTNTEWVCLPRKPENGCGSLRPLSATLSDGVSIDGESGNFCKPPTTTCSAVNHFGSGGLQEPDSCEADDDCGLPGVADGFCLPFRGDENARTCTYLCLNNPDCRSGVTCGSSEGTEEVVCSLD